VRLERRPQGLWIIRVARRSLDHMLDTHGSRRNEEDVRRSWWWKLEDEVAIYRQSVATTQPPKGHMWKLSIFTSVYWERIAEMTCLSKGWSKDMEICTVKTKTDDNESSFHI
jgi:uncharacterized protein YfaQ (DUF2300 family)